MSDRQPSRDGHYAEPSNNSKGHSEASSYDCLIQQLVTGDLDEVRRSALLNWLEQKPERWRQCGLAFLEAQTWREAFLEVVGGAEPMPNRTLSDDFVHNGRFRDVGSGAPPEKHFSATPSQRPSRAPFVLRWVGAVAASALLAYPLGVLTGSKWSRTSASVDQGADLHASQTDSHRSKQFPSATGNRSSMPQRDEPRWDSAAPNLASSIEPQTFAVMKLHSEQSGTREFHVPIVAGSAIDEQWLQTEPNSLPEHVQDELERRGYQLQQRRRFFDVRLEDGRHAIVPVDQYQVSFVGHASL